MFCDITINSLKNLNDKWFINLSGTDIPTSVSCLLQLGNKFDLPPSINKKYAIHEFIKDLENNNRNFNDACKSKIRSEAVPKLENFLTNNINNNNDKLALNNYNKTIDFCKNNPNVVFTKADKGNVTVALDKSDYIKKMEEMLSDRNTYILVKKDPMKSIEKELNLMLKALYRLATFLHKIISNSIPKNPLGAPNSFNLYKQISNKKINNSDSIISLDVTSLFTNIPYNLIIDSISKRWNYIEQKTTIPKNEFINQIKMFFSRCLHYFSSSAKLEHHYVDCGKLNDCAIKLPSEDDK
ncbi:hypothetical protein ALC62_04466 [Cyphomyrmex costatus]|uniref:Reverse transcriptase domain-containing protein n=1 Tax=Cyphomyrmex costatus TaxID=456900 RepID=A0A151IK74_9HYME|nr:hypothetical protein ALC62_04466 [Cyphomyrmex costatus]